MAGFGVSTRVDAPQQVILGACNAPLAGQGLQIEPDLGLLLPCNVVVRTDPSGQTLVSALNPELMATVTGRPELKPISDDAKRRLQAALDRVGDELSEPESGARR